ncbi:MAG: hypothetical protein GHCLOJNM_02027 [bacterium]|nr:hypothetical protein [bacterium]
MTWAAHETFLREIVLRREAVLSFKEYPFCLPVLRHLDSLQLHPGVTFLVGENGTGKSTLLESIAVAFGFNPEGGSKNFHFATEETHSPLFDYIKLLRGIARPRTGFFLRAETFYNLATYLDREVPDVLDSYGGKSLHRQSHGESFMSLVLHRFGGAGLYILDEPEAALSPMRQMAFLAAMHDLVKADSQFIVATHSPIILAYPDSWIYVLSEEGIRLTPYEETEHFRVSRDFLLRRELMLKELLED